MANTECEKILNLIPLYIDNLLSDYENDEVIKHLEKCSDCCNEYNYLKAIINATKNIPQKEIPSDFHKNLMEKVKNKAIKKKKRYLSLKHISVGVAAAAVVAISFVALGEISEPKETKQPDQYITSQLSDEPIQKDARVDTLTDYSFTAEEKGANRAKSNTQSAPKDATAEAKATQTAEQIPASISLDEEMRIYKTATVTLTEDNRDAVLEILSDFKQDDVGYIIEDIEDVIKKIKEIDANITINNNDANTKNYIIIK